uniref:Uncharacterized protein n=1 Tax=Rhizophora mucronata TaxID=61149 RepID=A0A2P2KPR1_RHIMU
MEQQQILSRKLNWGQPYEFFSSFYQQQQKIPQIIYLKLGQFESPLSCFSKNTRVIPSLSQHCLYL